MSNNNCNNVESIKKDIKEQLENIFPHYKLSINDNKIFISGVLILSIENKIIDRYLIEIEMPDSKSRYYPVIREIGNKIPKIADRHINSDGTACLFYPDNYKRYYHRKTKLSEFMKGPVFTYFIAQTYFEITGIWIFGELNHNEIGAYEFYSKQLGVKDPEIIINLLNFLLENFSIKKSQLCICGSLKRFKNCHHRKLMKIKRDVPREMMQNSVKKISTFREKLNNYVNNQKRLKSVIATSSINNITYNKDSIARILYFFERKLPPKIYFERK